MRSDPGVGKTQIAAAYARRRIAEGSRLVAWVDASEEASLLAGLGQVATAAGIGAAGEDARVLAAGVRHWLEADGERRLLVFDNAGNWTCCGRSFPRAGRPRSLSHELNVRDSTILLWL
jgi:hypothetical protein